jgi:hypothetical protein
LSQPGLDRRQLLLVFFLFDRHMGEFLVLRSQALITFL